MDSARAILLEGYPENARLEMVRRGSSQVDLSGELGPTAKLTVQEGTKDGPYFVRFVPFEGISPEN